MGQDITLLRHFLDKLDIIKKKYDEHEAQKDQFNVFSALRENYNEVKLHSRFISSLLSWTTNNHYSFLDEFITIVESRFKYEADSLEIYPSYEDKSEYKDIDILLIDRTTKYAIIIENKIYAPDSNHREEGQLEKYYRTINEDEKIPEENIEVFYLTLDGHDPSDESVSTKNHYPRLKEIVQCISYSGQIKGWLTQCVKNAYDKPFQRETLLQYIKLINGMTNHSEQEEQLEIVRLIGESESNSNSAKLLIDNIRHIHWHIISIFWNALSNELSSYGYQILHKPTEEDFDSIIHMGIRKKNQAHLFIDIVVKDYVIRIEEYINTPINYGIKKDKRIKKNYIQAFNSLIKQENSKYQSDEEFFIFAYHSLQSNILFDSWEIENDATFNLIRADFRNKIIQIIVDDINGFVKDINRLVKK